MNVADSVLAFFDARGGLPGATREEQLRCAYLDEHVLDSMGIIDMVSQFEETFGVRFEADHLQSLEFQTVGGLVQIIEQLRSR
jgi:acyl carrier protein